jgi:hypothetical protein
MFNQYLAHELAKERMYSAIREAQRARRRVPMSHSSGYMSFWSTLWSRLAHPRRAVSSPVGGRVALKRR